MTHFGAFHIPWSFPLVMFCGDGHVRGVCVAEPSVFECPSPLGFYWF